jgi:hypothetical protein
MNSWPLFMNTARLSSIKQERESKAKVVFFQDYSWKIFRIQGKN